MSKPTRFTIAFDNHGDRIEPRVRDVFFRHLADWKPTLRIHGGDCFDLRSIRKGASEEDRLEGMKADVEEGLEFMKRFKPQHWLRGNHDERLWDKAQSTDGKLAEYSRLLIDRILDTLDGVHVLPYEAEKGVLKIGHLRVIHGYHSGLYAARMAAMVYGSVVMGHTHTIDHAPIAGVERRMGRCAGCLCQRRMDYNRAMPNTLRQAHGWAYGLLFPNGTYQLFQAEEIAGRWYLPSEYREYSSAG